MFRSVLTTLVATSIFACPLICKSGSACCGKDRAAAVQNTCCSRCHFERSDGETTGPVSPEDHSPFQPQNCRQCLCGGAVIEKSSVVDVQLEAHWSLPSPLLYAAVAATGQSRFELFSVPLRPDDGANHGRALCQLYMSFQC